MKIFLLLMIVILFVLRVKHTPRMLSKKKYLATIKESLDKLEDQFKEYSDERVEITKMVSLLFGAIVQIAVGIVYIMIGARINVTYFTILTLAQLLTVAYTSVSQLKMNIFDPVVENHKFRRWYFLFNVVLDYIYYPLAFYLLIK